MGRIMEYFRIMAEILLVAALLSLSLLLTQSLVISMMVRATLKNPAASGDPRLIYLGPVLLFAILAIIIYKKVFCRIEKEMTAEDEQGTLSFESAEVDAREKNRKIFMRTAFAILTMAGYIIVVLVF